MRTLLFLLAVAIAAAACTSAPPPDEAVLAFFRAAKDGDLTKQIQVLAAAPDTGHLSRLVLRERFPDKEIRHFSVDSVLLLREWGDSAIWRAWGREPNWLRLEGGAGGFDGKPTPQEIAALPLVTAHRDLTLVRTAGRWVLPLHTRQAGPALATRDTVERACGYHANLTVCREVAGRLRARSYEAAALDSAYKYLQQYAIAALRDAAIFDSISLVVLGSRVNKYPHTAFTSGEYEIANNSSAEVRVVVDVVDAAGAIVDRDLLAAVPEFGVARGRYIEEASHATPLTFRVGGVQVRDRPRSGAPPFYGTAPTGG